MARRRFEEPSRETSIRPDRIGSLLGRIIQERLVRGFADPRIRGMISITGVDVAPDLRSAIVKVSVLPDRYGARTLSGLRSVSGVLRKTIRDETSLRRVPDLEFRLDDSLKRAAELDDAIRTGLGPASKGATETNEDEAGRAGQFDEQPDSTAEDGRDTSEESS